MTIPNRIDIKAMLSAQISEIAALDIEQLAMLAEEVAAAKAEAAKASSILSVAMNERFGHLATAARALAKKDTGTVRVRSGDYVVIADLPKEVEWDQAELKVAVDAIAKMGEPVSDYVTTTLKVSETKYGGWPTSLKSIFAAARTVATGKPTYKIEKAK
jgi:hypothetical protein